jgi:REP element-mobilizing transposase RayT
MAGKTSKQAMTSRGHARAWKQLTFDDARTPCGRGGWRPGAGRPRGRKTVEHGRRARFPERYPQHVTLRVHREVGEPIRRRHLARIIRGAIRASHKHHFRVIEFNVLADHVHMIVEARGAAGLARGMQGLNVRIARRLNRALRRRGTFFAERYHTRALKTPREVRHAIHYVLRNHQIHLARAGTDVNWFWIDPFSSAPWFASWARPSYSRDPDILELRAHAPPTAPPTVWLLTHGWQRGGLL